MAFGTDMENKLNSFGFGRRPAESFPMIYNRVFRLDTSFPN